MWLVIQELRPAIMPLLLMTVWLAFLWINVFSQGEPQEQAGFPVKPLDVDRIEDGPPGPEGE